MCTDYYYYFFSTVAQVLASISALLAVFTHYKLTEIKDFLVGDGKATWARMNNNEPGYLLLDKKDHKTYQDRVRDSVERKNILGIEKVIEKLASQECMEGKTIESNPRGLQSLEKGFKARGRQLKKVKCFTKLSLLAALSGILVSLVSILFTNVILTSNTLLWGVFLLTGGLILVCMSFTFCGIYEGLREVGDANEF